MIPYKKESWEEIKTVLEALFYDWTLDFEGNLIIHWEDFDIRNEKTNVVVDHVDHMWCKFIFQAYSYYTTWSRSDKNPASRNYIHPHVSESANNYCTGDYPRGQSLCRDLHYLTSFVGRYNEGQAFEHAEISTFKSVVKVNKNKLRTHLATTYFFNPALGTLDVKDCELVGITEDELIQVDKLPEIVPSHYIWKDKPIERKWNEPNTTIHSINLKDYIDDKQLKSIVAAYTRARAAQVNTQVS